MPIVTWLLSRVAESPTGEVEVNQLYNTFDFEMKESGINDTYTKRSFYDHILKVFPNAMRKRSKSNTTITTYTGISLKPVQSQLPLASSTRNTEEIKKILPAEVETLEVQEDYLKCSIDTNYYSNGNKIKKNVTFFANGQWTLEVSGKSVDLSTLFISNTYTVDNIEIVLKCVRLVHICQGIQVNKPVIMTRFHTLETFKCNENETKRLRPLGCERVIPLNAKSDSCTKCLRMTFKYSNSKKDLPEQQNESTSNVVSESDNINSPTVTKEQLKNLIPAATDEMLELFLSQAQNVSRDPRGRRWTENIITLCLQWFCRSPQSYECVRASNFLVLPSRSVLLLYKNKVKHEVGFDDNIFRWMYEESKRQNIPVEGLVGGLIIDEMTIQQDIQINKSGDIVELSGLMDVGQEGNISYMMRKGKNEKVVGTHVLQLVFLGLTGFRFPVAHFVSDGIQAPELYPLFWEAVDKLKMYGFTVVYTCMDGAQSNRTFMNINIGSNSKTFTTPSPCSFGSMIFMMDISHVVKKIRNNILKSGISKQSTRLLTLSNGDTIQWQMFIDCYNWDKMNSLQLHRKLTNEHLYPSNQAKMRNHLAEDILGSEMLHLILQYQQYLGEKGSVLNGVVELLKNTSKLINIFRDMRPVKVTNDPRLDELLLIAEWFDSWKNCTMNDNDLPQKRRGTMIMSLQCHEDIQSSIIGFVELCKMVLNSKSRVYITPGLINSDVVENTFNQQRSTYNGANSNPNALQYRRTLNNVVLGQNVVSQKANAGKNRVAALPFGCSLKQNPRKRPSQNRDKKGEIKVIKM